MNLNKITLKLIKYYIYIISTTILICFIGSSTFISKFYKQTQLKTLQKSAYNIYEGLKEGYIYEDLSVSIVVIKDDKVIPLGRRKMAIQGAFRNVDFKSLSTEGTFENIGNESFLYYKMHTELGEVIAFENTKYSSDYLKIIYSILLIIFILSIVLCIPLIAYVGKKFTNPIIELKKSSQKIASGNFNFNPNIKTGDEIEELAMSLQSMAINLEKKYELQKDFIANVSHDFKTPLSIIRSYSEAIKDGLVEGQDINNYSGEIIEEVDRLNKLVIEILELSKLQSGKIPLNKEYLNIKTLLKECIEKFKPLAKEKNISLLLEGEEFKIHGDRTYLLRVIYNFIDNALKFSPCNEEVLVCTSYADSNVKVSIINKGSGISQNMLENIWNKYYKHEKSGGIGLGLPICSEILTLHKFQYGVLSKENQETEFYFLAPIK
ncbi:HAMP domain-containing sensor histidine kinase [Clostridium sp. MB40-C1]|uniref:sensor histidine kinase n=1 Tax=Clostridium sp. MB40-C1 TaxID=3070996 RepID=UPI0027DF6556|nr:HAMP domain-containing sensor histidine kinase [Clostridium sp. MB40-C1]WMJ79959.1 HAMP domain-containing sensor histidine kinase [Clostridium sp. MB40-C1]